jgi:hypothetical protein
MRRFATLEWLKHICFVWKGFSIVAENWLWDSCALPRTIAWGSSVAYHLCRKDLSTGTPDTLLLLIFILSKMIIISFTKKFHTFTSQFTNYILNNFFLHKFGAMPFELVQAYCVAVFCRLGHPLREKLRDLGTMNMSRCIQGYSDVLSMDNITPSESFTRHELSALLGTPLIDVQMESALAGAQDTMYSLLAPRELSVVTSEYVESAVFYTDGTLIEGSVGFAIHQTGVGGFGFKLSSPAELSALFMALRNIRERKMLDSNRYLGFDQGYAVQKKFMANSSARI